MQKVRRIAKAVVAVAGFVVIAGNMIVSGEYDADTLFTAAIAAAVAVGVYRIPNNG